MGAAQTHETHEAFKEIINLSDIEDSDDIERYIQALAISTNPNPIIIRDLLKILAESHTINAKVETSMVHAIGSIAYRYARLPGQNYSSDVVLNVQSYLNDSLSKCREVLCYEKFLNGINNLQSIDTIPLLFEYVNHEERTISVAAMKALSKFPSSTWIPAHIEQFEDIFYQTLQKYDSSARTLALDIVLNSKLSDTQLKKLISYLKAKDKAFEVKKYLLEKLQMLCDESEDFNNRVQSIVRKDVTLNNYHIIGQKGLTTALSRKYSVKAPFNGTLTSIQEIFGGILKRGVVDMTIDSNDSKFSYFTVIYRFFINYNILNLCKSIDYFCFLTARSLFRWFDIVRQQQFRFE